MKKGLCKFVCFMVCFVILLPMFEVTAEARTAGFVEGEDLGIEDAYLSIDAFSANTPPPDGYASWGVYLQQRRSSITLPNRRLTEDERNDWIVEYHASGGISAFEVEVLRLVNEERLNRGLNELAVDMTFMYATRFYSQTMANLNLRLSDTVGPYRGAGNTMLAFGADTPGWRNGAGPHSTP